MKANTKSVLVVPLLITILGITAVASPSWGTQLFYWNADQLNTTSLGGIQGVGPRTSIDTAEKVEGTGSMKLVIVGNDQSQMGIDPGDGPSFAGDDGGSLYYRWWMKMSPSFTWGTVTQKTKSARLKRLGDVPSPYITLYLHKTQVYVGECWECSPGGNDPSRASVNYDFEPATNPAVTQWHEYIIHIKKQNGNGSDGEFHFYIDGVQQGSGVTGMHYFNSPAQKWVEGLGGNMARPLPQLNDASAGGTIWIDDVSLDTTFNSRLSPTPASAPEPICPGGSNPDPNVIWCDNFDDAIPLTQKYFEYDNNAGDFVPVPGAGLGGSSAMQVKWQLGEVNAGHLTRTFGRNPVNSQSHSTIDFPEIYWRLYLKMQPGWTGSPDKLSRATILANSNWSQAMIAHLWSNGDFLQMDPASGIDANGNLATTKYNDFNNLRWLGNRTGTTAIFTSGGSGKWYCVEAHVKLNTPGLTNGVFEFWIDNNLEASRNDLNWVGTWQNYGINAIFFENYWNAGAPGERIRYFDNIIISTRRVGCFTSGTPLNAPTGLTVR